GTIPRGQKGAFDEILNQFKAIEGVRGVKSFVTEVAKQEAVINISDRYAASGLLQVGKGPLSVVINGRILTEGDVLDGMKITSIHANAVYLEKDGVAYKIDVKR